MDREDERPAKKPEVPIGDDLALLSVEELEWRKSLRGGFRVQTVTLVRIVNLLVRGGE